MVMLTEEFLWGEWFYLEEDEPFDPLQSTVFKLVEGKVSRDGREVGTYTAGGEVVTFDMQPTGSEQRWSIIVRAPSGVDPSTTTSWLVADSSLEFPDQEPWSTVGALRRKTADYVSLEAIRPIGGKG